MAQRHLILEDGTTYVGEGFGAPATTFGEIIFHTAMSGYQEIITNPIYDGQILVFTMPIIGASGIQAQSYESVQPKVKGVIARDLAEVSTNRQRRMNLDRFLKHHNVPGIYGIDTRALTRHLRETGPQKAALVDFADDHAVDQLRATVLSTQQIANTATPKPYANPGRGFHIVVIDFGLKHGILRMLADFDANVTVLPYTTTVDEVLTLDPDGIVLSTGPGDPHRVSEDVLTLIRVLQTKVPLFGIGLGHELLALANDAQLKSLPAEHHGYSHPIQEIVTKHIFYAMQGQGYTVDRASLDRDKLFVTHVDLIDGAVQGLRHRDFPAFSVQFFPDAAPGPLEAADIFTEFFETVAEYQQDDDDFDR